MHYISAPDKKTDKKDLKSSDPARWITWTGHKWNCGARIVTVGEIQFELTIIENVKWTEMDLHKMRTIWRYQKKKKSASIVMRINKKPFRIKM